jgi:hypothetical protein
MPKPHEMSHSTLSEDTDPEAEKVQLEILRRMPAWKKFELVSEAIETSRVLAMAGLRHRYSNAPPEELHRRFLDLWLGEELASEVYGPIEQASRRLP